MSIVDVLGFLAYFGIDRQSVGPLVVAGVVLYGFFWVFAEKPIQSLRKQLKDVRHALSEVQVYLTDADGKHWQYSMRVLKVFGQAKSPMVPNDLGSKILEESGFMTAYPGVRARVFPLLDARNTRTLYDAEKNSQVILQEISNDPLFDNIKAYVVDNSHHVPDLDVVFGIASWLIRDDYGKMRNIEK